MLLGHADNQGLQLWVDLRSSWSLALGRVIKFLRHKPMVPGQDGVGLDDGGHFLQGFLPSFWPMSANVFRLPSVNRDL